MEDDLLDLLQTVKVISDIENDKHPTIKLNSNRYKDFKKWFDDKYINSGLIDEIINNIK